MDDADDRAYVRAPTLEDLARICAALNASGAGKACDVTYEDAAGDAETIELLGVPIPLASKRTLLLTKRTIRPSDEIDRRFLEERLKQED